MQQQICPVSSGSLSFSRFLYGGLALVAYLFRIHWLVGVVSIFLILGMFSLEYDIVYQVHLWFSKKFLRKENKSIQKERGELSFVCGMAGIFFLVSFLLLYFGKIVSFAWVLVLLFSGLLILSGVTGSCIVSLLFVFFKKVFRIK